MFSNHQLIINCGLNDQLACQLSESGLERIEINGRGVPAQYNYYLSIGNYFEQSCQLSLQAQTKEQENSSLWPLIDLKIFYQNHKLFEGDLSKFVSEKIDFLLLEAQSSKLYRLEFYLPELNEDFENNFDLNFVFNCQEKEPVLYQKKPEVLAVQSENLQETLESPAIEVKENLSQQKSLLIFISIIFLFILSIVFLFLILRKKKPKQILISSKKGNLYEQKEKH